jgi:hypothetical protein
LNFSSRANALAFAASLEAFCSQKLFCKKLHFKSVLEKLVIQEHISKRELCILYLWQ